MDFGRIGVVGDGAKFEAEVLEIAAGSRVFEKLIDDRLDGTTPAGRRPELVDEVPDQRHARIWFDRGVPLEVAETALLLACLRRKARPSDVPPLPRIRSLAYFQPVVEELQEHPAPGGYLQYLRLKLRGILDNPVPAKVQKSTFSDDR